jgi:DNA-binding transcriptional MerR regulator
MRLKTSDLEQLTEARLLLLDEAESRRLLGMALQDLRELLDRLSQGPENSSRPPGSVPLFDRQQRSDKDEKGDASHEADESSSATGDPSVAADGQSDSNNIPQIEEKNPEQKKKAGRQIGATGYSRNLTLPVTAQIDHRPASCVICGDALSPENFVVTGGHYVLDIERSDKILGLTVSHTKHRYGKIVCLCCNHINDSTPERVADDPEWQAGISPWNLVGPHLACLIVFLHVRMHGSYARIREFLNEWMGIDICTATLNRTVQEMGRALAPVEKELICDIQQAALLHIDETGHLENGDLLWLWVFISANTCLYQIGSRSAAFLDKLLVGVFEGCLMSDGYPAYRRFLNRLRCWAHLMRKGVGVRDSHEPQMRSFGLAVVSQLENMMAAIYTAREGPPLAVPLNEQFALELAQFRQLCESYRNSEHTKARALAREFLNDWDAIFAILSDPSRPLTNNLAERMLRHWVIHRRITYGTRTHAGTRAFGIIASVVDTCRLRKINPWQFLASTLTARRNGATSVTLVGVGG